MPRYLSAGLLRRAVEIDSGLRATRPRRGFRQLVIDEARYADSVQRR